MCRNAWAIVTFGFLPHEAQPPGPCWFCLASPDVEKHLVVNIGTHVSYFRGSSTEKEITCLLSIHLNFTYHEIYFKYAVQWFLVS